MNAPPVDAAADVASVLLEAVEAAEGEAPGPAAHAVPVCRDVRAEVLPAEAFGVEEGHFVCYLSRCLVFDGIDGVWRQIGESAMPRGTAGLF